MSTSARDDEPAERNLLAHDERPRPAAVVEKHNPWSRKVGHRLDFRLTARQGGKEKLGMRRDDYHKEELRHLKVSPSSFPNPCMCRPSNQTPTSGRSASAGQIALTRCNLPVLLENIH